MRKTELFNENWSFSKKEISPIDIETPLGEAVKLPHTWNALDGQDGGNDYYRGKCWYTKEFEKPAFSEYREVWLEFGGVNMVAEVYLNGKQLARHEGGYSTFRVNLTDYLEENNLLAVSADNSPSRTVYPQKADFTFYGGIYRDVKLITLPKSHFALGCYGGPGIRVTAVPKGGEYEVEVEAYLENTEDGAALNVEIEGVGKQRATAENGKAQAVFTIENPRLWNGTGDPYLYTAKAVLENGGDSVRAKFGCRSFSVDAEKGFFLNGQSYPLCGVSRHQDWQGAGYAVTADMHKTDMELIREMGANTVRLAHYQHDQYFYDLCDEAGMIVWAEIPYISEHMPEANENTMSQMTELIVQNYNHPSIVCWGLSNEITSVGGESKDIIENHRRLNELCHSLDKTRPTTMAHVFMLPIDSELVMLPDIRSYNLYYGWYLGELVNNDEWFDAFREKYPNEVIGLSEYGADANTRYQSANPERGDYSESYQAVYHEHMLAMWAKRPYIWAMHVWNMFDFAADGRDEGGKHGINQKGLVSFDRKTKKDAFYIYKAYLSQTPFVHLCGRRYAERAEDITKIKVYSNQPEVSLYIDGNKHETKKGDKIFIFELPISGEHTIEAAAGQRQDKMRIVKTEKANPDYSMTGGEIINWFDREDMLLREGYYSIKDTMADIKKSPEGAALLAAMNKKAVAARGDVAQGVVIPKEMQEMLDKTTLESMLKQISDIMPPEAVVQLNRALSQIPKV